MHLQFFGAAGEVTGSCHIVEVGRYRILLDCGLVQGGVTHGERNREPFPFDAADVDAVILSHSHIDHCGRLPLLHKRGFRGPVFATAAGRDLARILLLDCAAIAAHDAERAARKRRRSGGRGAVEPLFTRVDAEAVLGLFRSVRYGQPFEVLPGVELTFRDAGHILGSTCVCLRLVEGDLERRLVFSGDLGQYDSPILRDPEAGLAADLVLMESTYGDRRHRDRESTLSEFGEILLRAQRDGGNVLIPAFAVGRSQEILYQLGIHYDEWQLADWQLFLDSPMAIDATDVFCEYVGDHRMSQAECKLMCATARYAHTAEDSKAIDRRTGPMVIVSASGMATGGRVLHHLRRFLPDPKHTVLFVGYQAAGTRGRALVDGTDEVKIHGEYVTVRAQVVQIQGLSAHADYREMIDWLAASKLAPQRVFVTHGEPAASDAFRRRLRDTFAWNAVVPEDGSTWSLT